MTQKLFETGIAVPALAANGPHPDLAPYLNLFGQFVGSWDLDVTWYEEGRPTRHDRGEWHFAWVLEGRAVQDVWIVPPRRKRNLENLYEYGTTIRFYDSEIEAWRSTWHGPMWKVVIPFIGRKIGEEIVLEGRHWSAGWPMHWIFSEITDRTFFWRNVISKDDGESRQKLLDFSARRSG
jgi:hypothetical protein